MIGPVAPVATIDSIRACGRVFVCVYLSVCLSVPVPVSLPLSFSFSLPPSLPLALFLSLLSRSLALIDSVLVSVCLCVSACLYVCLCANTDTAQSNLVKKHRTGRLTSVAQDAHPPGAAAPSAPAPADPEGPSSLDEPWALRLPHSHAAYLLYLEELVHMHKHTPRAPRARAHNIPYCSYPRPTPSLPLLISADRQMRRRELPHAGQVVIHEVRGARPPPPPPPGPGGVC